jgi:hypothetical protein
MATIYLKLQVTNSIEKILFMTLLVAQNFPFVEKGGLLSLSKDPVTGSYSEQGGFIPQ